MICACFFFCGCLCFQIDSVLFLFVSLIDCFFLIWGGGGGDGVGVIFWGGFRESGFSDSVISDNSTVLEKFDDLSSSKISMLLFSFSVSGGLDLSMRESTDDDVNDFSGMVNETFSMVSSLKFFNDN